MIGKLLENPVLWLVILGLLALAVAVLLSVAVALRAWRRRTQRPTAQPLVPPPPPSAGPFVEVVGASGGGRRFPLKPEGTVVGRAADCDIVIGRDLPGWETVSARHARIYRHGTRWAVEDLGALNGVYVNGARTGRNLLRDGARVGIGGLELLFRTGASPSAEDTAVLEGRQS
jgi:pSer/pThr/pTyr-binding forkhead associated (FHA) protein